MATLKLTARFSQLDDWAGRLFDAEDGVTITARSATSLQFRYGPDHSFSGYTVKVSGTGFKWQDGRATEGKMASVTVLDGAGKTVVTLTGLANGPARARDLDQFFVNVFGAQNEFGNGPSPNGSVAWSYLLAGNDVISGTSGNDWQGIPGLNAGSNRYNMKGGDDYVTPGAGADTIRGGAGFDEVSYMETTYDVGMSATQGVRVNVARGTIIDAWGQTDRIFGVESFRGTRFTDTFLGSDADEQFTGGRGADTINGGGGRDRVRYGGEENQGGLFGIVADLETGRSGGQIVGKARDTFGNTDRLVSIEDIRGTNRADKITGSSQDNQISGEDGRDMMRGGGGADQFVWRRDAEFGDGDVIADFSASGAGRDRLAFDREGIAGLSDTVSLVNGSAANAARGQFIFNPDTDTLYWDRDGTGSAAAVAIVKLTGVASLSQGNIEIWD